MNALVNRVQLIGSLGADPEVKTFDNGKKMARISLATNETYRNQNGEKITDTTWHRVTAWGKTCEILEKYVRKGDKLAVEAKLRNNSFEDKEGNKRHVIEIVAQDVLMLGGNKK